MVLLFKSGLLVDLRKWLFRCAVCGTFFHRGETVSLNAEGVAPFRWIHLKCEKESAGGGG